MSTRLRHLLHRYVPAHFADPVGLATRLLRSQDPAARFALFNTALGVVAAPADLLFSAWERSRYRRSHQPRHPQVFVCGPPRSGTTLVYQTLVNNLDVAYFNNLTAMFSRSPLVAQRLLGRFLSANHHSYESFYGRTTRLSGTNDALVLWDRWLGRNRVAPPQAISADRTEAMRQFFAACDAEFDKPLVNKNNSLNLSAHLVSECLPQAHFLCLTRDRVSLAKSLYTARQVIHGSSRIPYGVRPKEDREVKLPKSSPIESVCDQVLFYERQAELQLSRIGPERFWLVSYEEFCADPGKLVARVAKEILQDSSRIRQTPPGAFDVSLGQEVPERVADEIAAYFAEREEPESQPVSQLSI